MGALNMMDSPPEWINTVLKHLDGPKDCVNLALLSKSWHRELTTSCFWWETLCAKLAHEKKLYLSLDRNHSDSERPAHSNSTTFWKKLFEELWSIRNQFSTEVANAGLDLLEGAEEEVEEEQSNRTFSIGVCVRFKPPSKRSSNDHQAQGSQRRVVIPLHQRLPLIKAKYGNDLSNSEAMAKWYGNKSARDPWADAFIEEESSDASETKDSTSQNQKENTKPEKKEKQQQGATTTRAQADVNSATGSAGIVNIREQDASVLAIVPATGLREFKFDKVFDSGSSQGSVHCQSSRRVVMDFLNGFNGTVMVYGQTGSGKTFTMFGPQANHLHVDDSNDDEGIAQRTCREVLEALKCREDVHGIGWRLGVTYVEVYGQEVYDLLKGGEIVGQSRVAGQRYVLDGQTEWPVDSLQEIHNYLSEGDAQKRKACTAMNERSSRAHTVFILSLTQTVQGISPSTRKKIGSKLMLVDLGGSEKLTKSRVHDSVKSAGTVAWNVYYEQRKHLTEALYINSGLFALKACIEALHEKQKQERKEKEGDPNFRKRHIYVPYQDSKLTMLLSQSLGGNARTVLIVTASKDNSNAVETLQSLRFGEQCTSIENTALCMSKQSLIDCLNDLEVKIKACEELVKKHERWETKRIIRKDMERDEVVTITVPVGAELYREELEKLLQKKNTLLGIAPEEGGEGGEEKQPPASATVAVAAAVEPEPVAAS